MSLTDMTLEEIILRIHVIHMSLKYKTLTFVIVSFTPNYPILRKALHHHHMVCLTSDKI